MATTSSPYSLHLKRTTLHNAVYLTVLISLLTVSYTMFVAPAFGFARDISLVKAGEALLLLLVSFPLVQRQQRLLAGQFLGLLYAFIIPSTLAYYMLTNQPRVYIYSIVGGFVLTVLAMRLTYELVSQHRDLITRSITFRATNTLLPIVSVYGYLWQVLVAGIPLLVFSSLYLHNGLPSLTALNLSRVYEVRAAVVYGPVVIGYLVHWLANVVNPFLITLGLYKRRALPFVAGNLFQVLLFLYTGHKSILFAIPLVFVAFILVSNRATFLGLLKTFLVMIVGTLILFLFFGHRLLPSLFIRRVFFVPPQVRSKYFEFFTQHPHIKMDGTSLGFLWTSPYDQHLATIIGTRYFDGAHANIGYLTSAFADFGVLGVAVFAILTGCFLSTIDLASEGLPQVLVAGIWVVPVFNLDASRLSTTLMTHGLLCALVVTVLLRVQHEYRRKADQ